MLIHAAPSSPEETASDSPEFREYWGRREWAFVQRIGCLDSASSILETACARGRNDGRKVFFAA